MSGSPYILAFQGNVNVRRRFGRDSTGLLSLGNPTSCTNTNNDIVDSNHSNSNHNYNIDEDVTGIHLTSRTP